MQTRRHRQKNSRGVCIVDAVFFRTFLFRSSVCSCIRVWQEEEGGVAAAHLIRLKFQAVGDRVDTQQVVALPSHEVKAGHNFGGQLQAPEGVQEALDAPLKLGGVTLGGGGMGGIW